MLEATDIALSYGASLALRRVSISAQAGAVTCLLGRNGVGKTSLLRAIVGAHPIASGAIRWEGADVARLPMHERARRGIAWVPQGRDIFSMLTVRENLETGFAAIPRRLRRVPDAIFELFPVLGKMLRRRGGDLSGGQQQQLAIARALVTRPRLLLLDEPTEGIQPSIIKDIGRVIALLSREGLSGEAGGPIAVLLVEQYLDFALELGTTLSVMDRGEIVLAGRADRLDPADVRRCLAV